MQITANLGDDAILRELGARIERARLERDLTQQQVADEAGVTRASVANLEAGASTRLVTVIRVLRVLGFVDALGQILPEADGPSPIELARLGGRRRRASGSGTIRVPRPPGPVHPPFRWGDES